MIMNYKCKRCSNWKQMNEFHPNEFEVTNTNPNKKCFDCQLNDAIKNTIAKETDKRLELDEEIKFLKSQITKLEKVNNIRIPASAKQRDSKTKHPSLNVYMERNNPDTAWLLYKGDFKQYAKYPNKFQPDEFVIVVNRPYGGKKYYNISQMYEWIFEPKPKPETPPVPKVKRSLSKSLTDAINSEPPF